MASKRGRTMPQVSAAAADLPDVDHGDHASAAARAAALRALPSIDRLLASPALRAATPRVARALAREVVDGLRQRILDGACPAEAVPAALAAEIDARLLALAGRRLRPLFNGTGVLLHTNAGRAPLAAAALEAIAATAAGYCNLELDVESGARGKRDDLVRPLLRWLGEAEDALVVNNGAAALLLALHALAAGRPVLVSRGELVEIGGSFRVPEIMQAAGVELVEVGSTNRTHAADYARAGAALAASGRPPALLLQIHRSNFEQVGFVATPSVAELAEVARLLGTALLADLGSGATFALAAHGLRDEPLLHETLAAGADLITASGDKLLGGPQAGLLLGRAELVRRCATAPMARALRPCRLTLAALEATLAMHARGEAVPLWQAIDTDVAELERDGAALAAAIGPLGGGLRVDVVVSEATVGGGSQPGMTLPSRALRLRPPQGRAAALAAALRAADPPWLGRVRDDAVLIDLRSLRCGRPPAAIGPALSKALAPLVAQQASATARQATAKGAGDDS